MGHSFFIIIPTLYFVINFATSYSIILTCKARASPQLSEVMFECPYKSTLVKHKWDAKRFHREASNIVRHKLDSKRYHYEASNIVRHKRGSKRFHHEATNIVQHKRGSKRFHHETTNIVRHKLDSKRFHCEASNIVQNKLDSMRYHVKTQKNRNSPFREQRFSLFFTVVQSISLLFCVFHHHGNIQSGLHHRCLIFDIKSC